MRTFRLTTCCIYEVINPYVSLAGLELMMYQPPSADPNTTEWHQSKVTAELWNCLFMSETSVNIRNPIVIRRGLVKQDRVGLHSVREQPSLLSFHHPSSISPLVSDTLFTLLCRNSGPKMETQKYLINNMETSMSDKIRAHIWLMLHRAHTSQPKALIHHGTVNSVNGSNL